MASHQARASPFVLAFFFSFHISAFLGSAAYSISELIPEELYLTIFLHKDDAICPAKGFYPYEAFVTATQFFPEFGTTGSVDTRKLELAAFLAQISHETTGGWDTAPDGPYTWGLCLKDEFNASSDYCDTNNTKWPCYPGKSYKGRGPLQISWNYNYGTAGEALGFDGLRQPDLVSNRSELAFKMALWFWMTPREPKPSCHDVMVGLFRPSEVDRTGPPGSGW
ncbi:hypothetical protein HPP92_001735 [Vanilla planifolia]|uniref:chitinase n=1 Tax=Vanilla planifolia TaxID=51239 RepID=A0A835SDB7_VANPL|nr:hypothetical protein HPP92_001735 [Vanilla planifolia]